MKAQMYNFNCWIKYSKEEELSKKFEKMLKTSGFGIVDKIEYYFPVQGYTCLWLLSESHFAMHSFPEEGRIYIEVSSCVKNYFDKFVEKVKQLEIEK